MSRRAALADGVEIMVMEGLGNVTETKPPPAGGRNAHVTIQAKGLRIPLSGWIDTADAAGAELWTLAQLAHAEGRSVTYRIEVHRKGNVDPHTPIADLAAIDKARRLVALGVAGIAPTRSEPQEGALTPGTDERRPGPAAPRNGAQAPASGDSGPLPLGPDGDPGPTESNEAPRRARVEEGRPWQPTNSDGSTNLGSYAATASIAFVELAHELLARRYAESAAAVEVARPSVEPEPEPPGPPPMGQVVYLARQLLRAADRAQAAIRGDHRVDRMDNSHTRARGAVRSALEVYPVPFGAEEAVRQQWTENLWTRAADLLRAGLALLEPEPEPEP